MLKQTEKCKRHTKQRREEAAPSASFLSASESSAFSAKAISENRVCQTRVLPVQVQVRYIGKFIVRSCTPPS